MEENTHPDVGGDEEKSGVKVDAFIGEQVTPTEIVQSCLHRPHIRTRQHPNLSLISPSPMLPRISHHPRPPPSPRPRLPPPLRPRHARQRRRHARTAPWQSSCSCLTNMTPWYVAFDTVAVCLSTRPCYRSQTRSQIIISKEWGSNVKTSACEQIPLFITPALIPSSRAENAFFPSLLRNSSQTSPLMHTSMLVYVQTQWVGGLAQRFQVLALPRFVSADSDPTDDFLTSPKDKTRTTLTMDDLSAALAEYGINSRKPEFFL